MGPLPAPRYNGTTLTGQSTEQLLSHIVVSRYLDDLSLILPGEDGRRPGLGVAAGELVCDGAMNFNEVVRRNGLRVALCNDHARRRFHKVCVGLGKKKAGSIAQQGLRWYQRLYAIERDAKGLPHRRALG